MKMAFPIVTVGRRLYFVIVALVPYYFLLSSAFHFTITNLGSASPQTQQQCKFQLCSTTAESSENHDLDAIEDEIIRIQSLQPYKSKQNRLYNPVKDISSNKVNNKNNSDRRKRRRRRQRVAKESSNDLPPWLSRYEDDSFIGSNLKKSPSFADPRESFDDEMYNKIAPMQRLQLAMSGIFYHSDSDPAVLLPNAISYFTSMEIQDVLDSIRVASNGNGNLMSGCADFLYLMLTLEEEGMLTNDFLKKERWDDDDINSNGEEWSATSATRPHSIITRDVLIAASFHYCDCVRARKAGVYDYVRRVLGSFPEERSAMLEEEYINRNSLQNGRQNLLLQKHRGEDLSSIPASIATMERRGKPSIERYGKESASIFAGAARLKKAEIMTSVFRRKTKKSQSDDEALRSFLVILSEDWRGLVIRSAACLYRLKGIVDVSGSSEGVMLSATTMRTARDALRLYAPLAQRLGMQRLKSELENKAFRILYPRQYSMATSLYDDIDTLKATLQVLTSRIEQLLKSDAIMLQQIDDVNVTSRIKEPYSMWRKMLRIYAKRAEGKKTGESLSIRWVPDAIALRVVLRASRLSPLEDNDSVRTREKMLCYYALQLLSDIWPASTANKAKDYIQNPKRNGYQSLHYTANLMINGDHWPFEVQIRSESMHRRAEYGVAAHWDYKMSAKPAATAALPSESSSPPSSIPTFALSVTGPTDGEIVDGEKMNGQKLTTSQTKSRVQSYIEALTTSRMGLIETSLYVFISSTENALDGHLISVDPLVTSISGVLQKFGVESESDNNMNMFQNGVIVTLHQELRICNGDVLTLPADLVDKLKINGVQFASFPTTSSTLLRYYVCAIRAIILSLETVTYVHT